MGQTGSNNQSKFIDKIMKTADADSLPVHDKTKEDLRRRMTAMEAEG